jgi:hypothetical protein
MGLPMGPMGSGFKDDKLIVKEKSRPTDNITAKATFYPNGWNP